MKLENTKLKNKVEKLKTQTSNLVINAESSPKDLDDLPIVVYDLKHQPPIVQTANPIFCGMLGYTMAEVIGKPWQNFIHPDFVQRTVEALERASYNQKIQRIQCYKHKQSGYFLTNDSYHIFCDVHDKPLSAIVTIRPEQETTRAVPMNYPEHNKWNDGRLLPIEAPNIIPIPRNIQPKPQGRVRTDLFEEVPPTPAKWTPHSPNSLLLSPSSDPLLNCPIDNNWDTPITDLDSIDFLSLLSSEDEVNTTDTESDRNANMKQ
eukprot:CAMPEP_0206192788 /NCGR_PEP_ID=MMETSP0166-20121206/6165_1 /ASSEMBLY_ACC=CAM_ASM_000260 /TAXON_ID=95228 /ORGANISM="Vannella robusta, Strain DIVA3 518/3/11/1/6" /LENGTH=261 /DNA_ID=CAMNT_0053609347 /DNA_START=313 /DNA_END=1098 /DNA_ORIENTATION=-